MEQIWRHSLPRSAAAASGVASGSAGGGGGISRIWSDDEVRALLGVWCEAATQRLLAQKARNKDVYTMISGRLRALGYSRDWVQCRVKVKNLKYEYRVARDGNFRGGPNHYARCMRFYPDLDRVMTARSRRSAISHQLAQPPPLSTALQHRPATSTTDHQNHPDQRRYVDHPMLLIKREVPEEVEEEVQLLDEEASAAADESLMTYDYAEHQEQHQEAVLVESDSGSRASSCVSFGGMLEQQQEPDRTIASVSCAPSTGILHTLLLSRTVCEQPAVISQTDQDDQETRQLHQQQQQQQLDHPGCPPTVYAEEAIRRSSTSHDLHPTATEAQVAHGRQHEGDEEGIKIEGVRSATPQARPSGRCGNNNRRRRRHFGGATCAASLERVATLFLRHQRQADERFRRFEAHQRQLERLHELRLVTVIVQGLQGAQATSAPTRAANTNVSDLPGD